MHKNMTIFRLWRNNYQKKKVDYYLDVRSKILTIEQKYDCRLDC